jgi:hypothetical protein
MAMNLPGTLFNKAMKARRHLSQILSKIISERRAKNVLYKDLQVKSSPPAQTTSQIHSDPTIISLQSQYSQPSQASNAFGPAASGSLPDLGSHGAHSGVPASPIRGAPPLYQATRNLGSWGSQPVPPGANGTGLAMPMYWQGYYGPATGLPHVQQQPLHFQPPPGMPIPPTVQQHLQNNLFWLLVLSSLPTGLSTTIRNAGTRQFLSIPYKYIVVPGKPCFFKMISKGANIGIILLRHFFFILLVYIVNPLLG